MKTKKILSLSTILVASFAFAFAGCESEGPLEDAGEDADEAVEDAGDEVEDATN